MAKINYSNTVKRGDFVFGAGLISGVGYVASVSRKTICWGYVGLIKVMTGKLNFHAKITKEKVVSIGLGKWILMFY